jgi:hypothetical protein
MGAAWSAVAAWWGGREIAVGGVRGRLLAAGVATGGFAVVDRVAAVAPAAGELALKRTRCEVRSRAWVLLFLQRRD